MPLTFDLNLLPIARQNGQDLPNLPGLYMVTPPRKTAHGRMADRLILYFAMIGNAPLSDQQQETMLARLAQAYYKTPGSVTTALRSTADVMNQFLLDRNVRSTSSGQQCIGILALAALRDDRLTLGVCGPAHLFLLTSESTQELHDPQGEGRGLGLTRAVSIRYYQVELHPGDQLVITHQPPIAWAAPTPNLHSPGLDSLRRRLLNQAGPDLNAVLVQADAGSGKLRLLHPKPPVQMAQPPAAIGDRKAEEPKGSQEGAIASEAVVEERQEPAQETPGVSEKPPEPAMMTTQAPLASPEMPATAVQRPVSQPEKLHTPPARPPKAPAIQAEKIPSTPSKPPRQGPAFSVLIISTILKAFTSTGRATGKGFGNLARKLATFFKRLLPDESLFTIPSSTMIFVAVAVAVVMGVSGVVAYNDRGRAALYQSAYEQAINNAGKAVQQTDPVELRTAWETTLDYLDQAEAYQTTPESEKLRSQALNALDQLDGIQRLDYQPAFVGGLGKSVHIIRMATTDNDLYMLNANGGNVMRAVMTGQGYALDPNFNCGPNPRVGPMIDIVPLPKDNNLKATLLGIDANGNLEYCIPGEQPAINSPAPPQTNWGLPTAFTLNSGDLYVLDPKTNAVWIYRGMDFSRPPNLFFGDQVPQMADAVDLAVNNDDLYLLHSDGHMTTCTYSGIKESPTRCDDPATYSDPRRGRENGPMILDARFNQIQFTPPPEPSTYLFDPIHQAIYHFSLRLTFQRQFRPNANLSSASATAFAISPNRIAFLAIGDQVYYASLP